jgi:phage pi2 protein 07
MKQMIINSRNYPDITILVDDEDYDDLIQYKWIVWRRTGYYSFYTMARDKKTNKRKSVFLSRYLMKAKKNDFVSFRDRNYLNFQKSNLYISNAKKTMLV